MASERVYRCTRTQEYLVLAASESEAASLADEMTFPSDWDVEDVGEDIGGEDVYRPRGSR